MNREYFYKGNRLIMAYDIKRSTAVLIHGNKCYTAIKFTECLNRLFK